MSYVNALAFFQDNCNVILASSKFLVFLFFSLRVIRGSRKNNKIGRLAV